MPADGIDVRLTDGMPLRGIVSYGDREPRAFEGWVSLAAAVQAIVADAQHEDEGQAA